MRVARLLAALLVTVITLEQAKGMQCKTACGWAGYDSGFYRDDQCGCFDLKPYEEFTSKRKLTLPSRGASKESLPKPSTTGAPITYDFY
jgi:hypothetical protein